MRCPTLAELPPPPRGRTGWPWTEETPRTETPFGAFWPAITIVTPNYNAGQFLEETIRSVLLQAYPNLEYFVIDGGSTDESRTIIEKYQRWLAYWVSERDRGQSDGINKGFARATGDFYQWINSDDVLTPGALLEVGRLGMAHPGAMIAGACEQFGDGFRTRVVANRGLSRRGLITFWRPDTVYQQPSLFVPRAAVARCGLLDESLQYCMDLEWYIRLAAHCPAVYTDRILSRFRVHTDSKSVSKGPHMAAERRAVSQRYWNELDAARAESECDAYCRREAAFVAWHLTIFHLLRSSGDRRAKVRALFREAGRSPVRLLRRETWGALRRIVIAS